MNLKIFFKFSLSISIASLIAGCSIYESDGHKALEKNSGSIVTFTGVNVELNARFECLRMVALPAAWQTDVDSLAEFSTLANVEAVLDNKKEIPTVLVYTTETRSFEGCTIEILDSKSSTQKLRDIVKFGEDLLLSGRD